MFAYDCAFCDFCVDSFTPLRLVERVSHYVCWIWAAASRSQDVLNWHDWSLIHISWPLANIVAPNMQEPIGPKKPHDLFGSSSRVYTSILYFTGINKKCGFMSPKVKVETSKNSWIQVGSAQDFEIHESIFGSFSFELSNGSFVMFCWAGLTHYCGVDVSLASLEVFITRIRDLKGNLPRQGAPTHGASAGLVLSRLPWFFFMVSNDLGVKLDWFR